MELLDHYRTFGQEIMINWSEKAREKWRNLFPGIKWPPCYSLLVKKLNFKIFHFLNVHRSLLINLALTTLIFVQRINRANRIFKLFLIVCWSLQFHLSIFHKISSTRKHEFFSLNSYNIDKLPYVKLKISALHAIW